MLHPDAILKKAPKTRKNLSLDALIDRLRRGSELLSDFRGAQVDICLADALMSAFAMFSLKEPSLLAFDGRRHDQNMKNLYHIDRVPSDTRMREILDLRQRAMDQFGDEFNIKTFHQVVLGSGNLPLQILRDVVDDWISTATH